jgi:tetratricopeptide (TPR) repeat protein
MAFSSIDPESAPIRSYTFYWLWMAGALHSLNEHERELELGRSFQQQHPDRAWRALSIQADALAALGLIDELNGVLDELENMSSPYILRWAFIQAVEILRASGREESARDILNRALDWLENRPLDEAATEDHRHAVGSALFLAGRLDEAQQVFDALVEDAEIPPLIIYRGTRGFISATRGDSALALEDDVWLAGLDVPIPGHPIFWWAIIAGALGRRPEAVSLLRQSYEGGLHHWYSREFMTELNPLRGYPAFEEWLRPRG